MSIPKPLIILFLFFGLISCEGAINIKGHVYNGTTKQGIDNVQVILVLGKEDTLWKCKPSISTDGQNELESRKYQLAFTDIAGYFSISSGLIGMGLGEQQDKVIFTKEGYKPVIIRTGRFSKFDSVPMQRIH